MFDTNIETARKKDVKALKFKVGTGNELFVFSFKNLILFCSTNTIQLSGFVL